MTFASFTHRRSSLVPPNSREGPGPIYSLTTVWDDGPLYSFSSRPESRQESTRSQYRGIRSATIRDQPATFGMGSRVGDNPDNGVPGAGSVINPEIGSDAHSFTIGKFSWSDIKPERLPGPADYHLKRAFPDGGMIDNQYGYPSSFDAAPRSAVINPNLGDPGAVAVPSDWSGGFSIGKLPRPRTPPPTVGPHEYEIKRFPGELPAPYKRRPIRAERRPDSPGPASYSPKRSREDSSRLSTAFHSRWMPGPGDSHTAGYEFVSRTSRSGAGARIGDRKLRGYETDVPGPGTYERPEEARSRAATIGSRIQERHEHTVGPADYFKDPLTPRMPVRVCHWPGDGSPYLQLGPDTPGPGRDDVDFSWASQDGSRLKPALRPVGKRWQFDQFDTAGKYVKLRKGKDPRWTIGRKDI